MSAVPTMLQLSNTTIEPGRALEALYATAYALLEAGTLAGATRAFRVMVRFAPEDERSWLGLGHCHERLEQDDVAAEIYGAGAVVGASARCMLAAARLARRSGEAFVARERFDGALELAEESGDQELAIAIRAEAGRP